MNKHIIEHIIPKSAEGSYYTLDFPVPGGLERLTVSYGYNRMSGKIGRPSNMVNIVDLGLMDGGGRFLGWSGSAKSEVFVGPNASTEGYLMTDIAPGQWKIIVGAYKIPDGGLTVRYEISYMPQAARWLVGDLHMHSRASDGQHSVYGLTQKAKKAGLDFIAVSDHNNYSENLHPLAVPELTLIPAVEWTHYLGHMNFFGVAAPFDNSFVANSGEEMLAVVAQAKEKGALVSVNHPKCNLCPYLWEDDVCFDLMEAWNGPMRPVNMRGIAWWHELLLKGRKIPIVGGSDFHRDRRPVRFARPVTHVFSQSPHPEDILEAISRGHSFVSSSVKGARLDLRCGGAMMGDTVAAGNEALLSVSAKALPAGTKLRLVTSEGITREWRGFERGEFSASLPVLPGWRFAYLVAIRRILGAEIVRAISNPIYFEREEIAYGAD